MSGEAGPAAYGDWMLRGLLAYEAELAAGRSAEQAREAIRPPRGQFSMLCGLLDDLATAWPPKGSTADSIPKSVEVSSDKRDDTQTA